MNKERRKRLQEAIGMLEDVQAIIEEMKDEEQSALDNLPEGLQGSERGEAMESNIENLDEAYDNASNAIDSITEVIGA